MAFVWDLYTACNEAVFQTDVWCVKPSGSKRHVNTAQDTGEMRRKQLAKPQRFEK